MSKSNIKTIPFLDVFLDYCVFHFGKEKGAKIYSYFIEKSEFIIASMIANDPLHDEHFLDVRFILQEIESDVFKNDISIYYVECPYKTNSPIKITFTDFIHKNNHKFYAKKGQYTNDSLSSTRLDFDIKIMDVLNKKNTKKNAHNHAKWRNKHTQRLDQLLNLVEENAEKSIQRYKKSFRELTRDEFREFIEKELQQNDGQHIVDHLWYEVKNDTSENS